MPTTPVYSYQVRYRIAGQPTFIDYPSTTTGTSLTLNGLDSSATYELEVYAFNTSGRGPTSNILLTGTGVLTVPDVINNLIITAETSTTVSLSWTAPISGLAPFTYQVQYKTHTTKTWTNFPAITSGTSQVIFSLIANTNYDFRVYAINDAGNGPVSNPISIITLSSSGTGQVTNVIASNLGPNYLTLGWTPPAGSTVSSLVPIVAPLIGAITAGNWISGTFTGITGNYLMPANYDISKSYPLLLYLHQSGAGSTTFDALRIGQLDGWFNTSTFRAAYPCIVLVPLCNQGPIGGDASLNWGGLNPATQIAQNAAIALVKQFIKTFAINPSRVYVTGNAMGGSGAWDMIIKYNRLTGTLDQIFAAALPLAGATYIYGDTGIGGAPTTQVISALQNVPIWAIHGAKDNIIVPRWDREMFAAEQAVNGLMKYTEDTNLGNNVTTYYAMPFGNQYWTWLFTQSLGAVGGKSTSYQAQYRISGQTGWTNYNPKTSQPTQLLNNLLSSTNYDFNVYAITASGNGPSSPVIHASTIAAIVGSCWNGADQSPLISLSNNNLTATSSSAVAQNVRSTTSRASGKVYFEIFINTITAHTTIGLSNVNNSLISMPITVNAMGYIPTDTSGILGFAFDLGQKLYWVTTPAQRNLGHNWNNSSTADPIKGIGGVPFSVIGPYFLTFYDDLGGAVVTVNFGTTVFNRAAPTGFSGWDTLAVTMAPGQVSSLITSTANATSVLLNWTAPVTGTIPFIYQMQYRKHVEDIWTNFGSTSNGTVQTINGLQSATSYDFQVYAINNFGHGLPSAPITTFATTASTAATIWNSIDVSPTIALSGGTLIATSSVTSPQTVRSTTSKTSNKVYFEITATNLTTNFAVGIATAAYALNNFTGLGSDANSVGFYPSLPATQIAINGTRSPGGLTVGNPDTSGAVISVAIDFTHHLIWFSSTQMQADGHAWNNLILASANPATSTGGISLAAISANPYFVAFNTLDSGSIALVNFGTSTFSHAVPSGYSGWNINQSVVVPGTTTVLTSGAPLTSQLRFADLTPGSPTTTGIPLVWTAPTDGSLPFAYQVQYRIDGGDGTWTNFAVKTSVPSQNITGLLPNTLYDFQVYATNAAGNGTLSAIFTLATANIIAAGQVMGVTIGVITATTVAMSWSIPTGTLPLLYTPQYRLHGNADPSWIPIPQVTTTNCVFTDLTEANTYDFSVTASNTLSDGTTSTGAISAISTVNTTSAGSDDPQNFAQNLNVPGAINWLPDGSMLITQRDVFHLAHITGNTVVSISVPNTITTQGDGGLIGLAIDPQYANNQFIYVCATSSFTGGYTTGGNTVTRYTFSSDTLSAPVLLLSFDANISHNGGFLAFGPDRLLYITTGDAQSPNTTSQNLSSLNGKILRINSDGTIPTDNPFNTDGSTAQDNPHGVRDAVWAFGFRLPQGICWQGNIMWATETGPRGETFGAFTGVSGNDKINRIIKGGNYGYPLIHGAGTVVDRFGKITLAPSLCSDVILWGPQQICTLNGSLYFGGLGNNNTGFDNGLYQAVISGTTLSSTQPWFLEDGRIRGANIGPDGLLYFSTSNNDGHGVPLADDDHIYQVIVPDIYSTTAPSAASNIVVAATKLESILLSWTSPDSGTAPFAYQVQFRITGTAIWLNYPQTTTLTNQLIDGLHDSTSYDFQIITSNALLSGVPSTSLTAVTSSVITAQMLPSGYLSADGNQFVDDTGKPVRIAAIAWAGAELGNGMPYGLWRLNYQTVLNSAKSAGFNAIRFQFSDQALDLSPGPSTDDAFGVNTTLNPDISAGMTTLQMWDILFDYCGQIGLKVWLAKMGNVGSSNLNGLWYGDGGYSATACAAHLIGLAQHYAGNPTVFAIELNNQEQVPPITYNDSTDTDIVQMWQDTGNAILAVNPDIMIFCQGPQGERSTPDYCENGACDLANVGILPVLTTPNKLAMAVRSFPNSIGNRTFLDVPSLDSNTSSLDFSQTNLQRTFGFIFTNNIYPVIISQMGSCRDGGVGNGTGVLDLPGNEDWLHSIVNFIASGIGGIPVDGFGPSWTWNRVNASGPQSGFDETVDGGLGIISYNDYISPISPPYNILKQILFFG